MIIDFINKLLAVCVIGSQIFIVFIILYFLLFQKKYKTIQKFLSKNGIKLSFLVALVATLSSLFYSNIAGFTPCNLCWFQRIFMYPEVIILGLALIKKRTNESSGMVDCALLLAFIGWLISIYHNYIYYKGSSSTICKIGESCIIPYFTEFGYIAIPIMSLTAFSLIIIFLLYQKEKR